MHSQQQLTQIQKIAAANEEVKLKDMPTDIEFTNILTYEQD